MSATRERCKVCGHANPVGFDVPDSVWNEVTPEQFQDMVVCLWCFIKFADEQFIEWDRNIDFYPVSLATFHSK